MAGTLPPMMQVMRDIGGVEIPESLAKLVGDDDAKVAEASAVVDGKEIDGSPPPRPMPERHG
jgi:flotillin